jgi:hypothetical protein
LRLQSQVVTVQKNIAVVEQNSQVQQIVRKAPDRHVTVGHCCCEIHDGQHQAQDKGNTDCEKEGTKFPRNAGKLLPERDHLSREDTGLNIN